MPAVNDPILVRFVKKYRPYNGGEVAGFKPGPQLNDLLKRGIVEKLEAEEAAQVREEAAKRTGEPAPRAEPKGGAKAPTK